MRDELDAVFCVNCNHSKLWHRRNGAKKWSNHPKSRGASIVKDGCEHSIRWGRKQEFGTCTCLGFKDPAEWMICPKCDGRGSIPRWKRDRFGEICSMCGSCRIVKRSVKSV